jgi:hypothetical protein
MKQSKRQQRLEAKKQPMYVHLAQSKEVLSRGEKIDNEIIAAQMDLLQTFLEGVKMHPNADVNGGMEMISAFHNINIMNPDVKDATPWIEMKQIMLSAMGK